MNILLTGQPGVGKTTCITRAVHKLAEACGASKLRGFYTSERRQDNKRVGFEMVCAASGSTAPLASVLAGAGSTGPRVGKYVVQTAELQRFAEPRLTVGGSAVLVVCDEIGKMELCSPSFLPQVRVHPAQRRLPLVAGVQARVRGVAVVSGCRQCS